MTTTRVLLLCAIIFGLSGCNGFQQPMPPEPKYEIVELDAIGIEVKVDGESKFSETIANQMLAAKYGPPKESRYEINGKRYLAIPYARAGSASVLLLEEK